MSGAEARKRFAAAVMTRIYSDGQLRLVRNARVVDEGADSPVELWATDDLTPQRIGEYVALALEDSPSLLDETELGKFIAEIRADGDYVPIPRAEGVCPTTTGTTDEGAGTEGRSLAGCAQAERGQPSHETG
jgi:hypothetical protein